VTYETKRTPELLVNDATPNDSDKTFTVPAGEEWEILSIYAQLTTTATVGNRAMAVEFMTAAGDIIASVWASSAPLQAASLSYKYTLAPGMDVVASAPRSSGSIPSLALLAGYQIRVYEYVAVDPAADDMTVRIFGTTRPSP